MRVAFFAPAIVEPSLGASRKQRVRHLGVRSVVRETVKFTEDPHYFKIFASFSLKSRMVNCAMVNCPNRTNKDRADNKKGVRFFNIPKVITNQCSLVRSRSERRRAIWLARINRKDLQDADVKPYTRVCSRHFMSGIP